MTFQIVSSVNKNASSEEKVSIHLDVFLKQSKIATMQLNLLLCLLTTLGLAFAGIY